jgi:hypothetical protein
LLSGFYQVVAALTVFVSYSTWNRKNITIIIVGHISGDQTSSICRLNDNRCLTHSSHDAVSTYKIFLYPDSSAQNSVIKPPFSSTLATYFAFWDKFGLNATYRLQVMVHRHLVRNDIDTISKTAYITGSRRQILSINSLLP